MDGKLRKILTDSIRDIETGASDVEGCLQRHPDRAEELRPHLELWSGLNAAAKAQPNFGSQQRGQHQLLGALADMERDEEKRMIPFLTPALAKAVAVVAGVALLAGGAAGASAALGGPDVADDVLSTVGIASSHNGDDGGGPAEGTLDNARDATEDVDQAQPGLDTAERGGENSDGPPPAAEDGLNTAEEHAKDGVNTAGDDVDEDDDADNGDDGDDDDDDNDDVPPDSVPEDAPAPDSVPVGPNR